MARRRPVRPRFLATSPRRWGRTPNDNSHAPSRRHGRNRTRHRIVGHRSFRSGVVIRWHWVWRRSSDNSSLGFRSLLLSLGCALGLVFALRIFFRRNSLRRRLLLVWRLIFPSCENFPRCTRRRRSDTQGWRCEVVRIDVLLV